MQASNFRFLSNSDPLIYQLARAEPLIAFEDRVKSAMERIYAKRTWRKNQQKWLDRLATQLIHDVIIDR